MLARVLPVLAAVVVVAGIAGCAADASDTTDADRIAVMRADTIYAHLVGDADAAEGHESDGTFVATTFAAPVDPWAGEDQPVGPTLAQRQAAIAALVAQLRQSGWSIISARCYAAPPESADAQTTDGYQWEVFGYRIRDGVPYAVHLVGVFADSSGFTVQVTMSTPFHADTASYFTAAPPGLAEGATCVESGDAATPTAGEQSQGTIWSLDGARG